jgi:iron complex outermembrane recepter protein
MRGKLTLLAGVCAGAIAFPAFAQSAADENGSTDIIVTAQRSDQRLQDVPIAVSAFSAEALEKQQIKNTSDLQLTLPNVTFTKTNFTSASFTIRGIGDLCVGISCDSATGIHMNDLPLGGSTRLFEGEFYDMAQVEVLRGPQGTLFGRNATSGVVNFRTARPKLSGFEANAEAEYGNYNSVKVKGAVNVPIGDIAAVRVAGFYLNRDGYTKNLFDNSRIDDRDMYGVRGSIRIEPSSGTRIDLMAQYFHEKDNRMRIQKQLCQRDPTGVLGCLNATRGFEMTNANSTAGAVLTSRQFFGLFGVPGNLHLGDLTVPNSDGYFGVVNPADVRTVNTDTKPTYFTSELILQGGIEQELGGGLKLKVDASYGKVKLESQQDYNHSVQNRAAYQTGLNNLAAVAGGSLGAGLAAYFAPIANALIPNGPTGDLCTSAPTENLSGVFGGAGQGICTGTPLDFDRSNLYTSNWSTEAIVSSDWDGPFNFLLGGIYGKGHVTENSYYVDAFTLDYATGVLGAWQAAATGALPTATTSYYFASPFYRNHSDDFTLKTYGLFGEAYYKFNDKIKMTVGLRYNSDKKALRARTTLLNWMAPTGALDAATVTLPNGQTYIAQFQPFLGGAYDADPGTPGAQLWQNRKVSFSEITGRAVIDWAITDDNLIYASYSRGYKSGGINPPLSVGFNVPESFKPEFVDSFEIGSKNSFADGKMTFNLTGFFYKYKDLQLSRIVNRTSVNDNVSAEIYGLEAEALLRPTAELTMNFNASYLHTKVTSVANPMADSRDYGGGRADAVIIKDVTTAANCAVAPNTAGNAAGANAFVTAINGALGLAGPTSFGPNSGIASTGAYSICSALAAQAAAIGTAFDPAGITVFADGIPTNIIGNKLPGAPNTKFSAGIQYAAPLGTMTLTPRVDFIYTGKSTGNIFNGPINAIPSFTQVNAQLQLDGPESKWFARAWVQNVFNKDSVTGLYVTDQSSGLFTNIFTLEPRRFGITAGMKF